ncbi:MAG: hypothetical protein HOE69_05155 [Euryarchaeota archaeon]|jgi:hypothetical protein|nr:hypothetical protein [Euryarchaeota archaeon]
MSFTSILPSIPPSSLRDIFFLLLIIPLFVRVYMLSSPLNKARIHLHGQVKDTITEINNLKIPGMKQFIMRESILLIIPYLFAAIIFWKTAFGEISLEELGSLTTIVTVTGLIFWLVVDIRRSMSANQFLNELLEKIINFETKLETFQISISAGLTILVGWKRGLAKLGKSLVKRTIRNSAKDKLESGQGSNIPGAKVLVNVLDAIDTILEAPLVLVREGIDAAVRKFDDTLESHFKQITERGISEIATTIFWSIFPILWLLFIIYLMPQL